MTKRKIVIRIITAGILVAMMTVGVRAYQQKSKSFSPEKDKQEIKENHVVFRDRQKNRKNLEDTSGESNLWDKNQVKNKEMDLSELTDSSILFEQQKNKKGSASRYADSRRGKKKAVNLTTDTKDTNGSVKVTRNTPSDTVNGNGEDPGQSKNPSTPSGRENDKKNTQDTQTNTGEPGDGMPPETGRPFVTEAPGAGEDIVPPAESEPPRYFPTVLPAATKEPEHTIGPRVTPAATHRPVPPEKTPVPPKGDSLIESIYPQITDYPVDGQKETQGKLHLNIIPILNIDREEYIYYGSNLTKEKLLCSVIVYVEDETGKVLYRLKELNDNFKIGTFPEVAREDFTVSFMFRQDKDAPWQTTEYEYQVLPYKYFLLDHAGNLYAESTPADASLNLLKYYTCDLTQEQYQDINKKNELPISGIIPYWIDEESGMQVSDQYQGTQKGWQVFRPAELVTPEEGYEVKLKRYMNLEEFGHCANLQFLQTLTKLPEGISDLKVMQGIHWVDLQGCSLNTLELATSTAVVEADGLEVRNAYIAPEDNPYFTTREGILYNKDETKLQAVPSAVREIDVPLSVQEIHIPAKNNIQKLVLSSANPPEINLENLQNTFIWVPESLYNVYYAKYEDLLPETVKLVKDSGNPNDVLVQDGAVLSRDGSILYSLSDKVKGNYIVPDSVRVIMGDALKNCSQLYELILPSHSVELRKGSLISDSLQKLVFPGSEAPLMEEGAFDLTQVETLMTPEIYQDWTAGSYPEKIAQSSLSIEEKDGCRYLLAGSTRILLQVPKDITYFDRENTGDVDYQEIASGAFNGCSKLLAIEFPEQVKQVDSYAFIDCENLQGILFDSKDVIRVRDQAFAAGSHLRFLAYNAAKGEFENSYCPYATGFCAANAEGYPKGMIVPHFTYMLSYASTFFMEGTPETGIYLYADYHFEDVLTGTYLIAATDNVHGKLELRKDIVEIIFYAFDNCKNTFTIDFTKYPKLFSIGERAFQDSGISGEITLPAQLQYLGMNCFSGCKALTRVDIDSELLEEIPMYAFAGDSAVTSLNIRESCPVKEIEAGAFMETGIETITFPETVEKIVTKLFTECKELKSITMLGKTPPKLLPQESGDSFIFGPDLTEQFRIFVPEEAKEQYQQEWKAYAEYITVR